MAPNDQARSGYDVTSITFRNYVGPGEVPLDTFVPKNKTISVNDLADGDILVKVLMVTHVHAKRTYSEATMVLCGLHFRNVCLL